MSLTDQQHAIAEELVRDGRYDSVNAVAQHGLELLRQQWSAAEIEEAALKIFSAERQAGEFVLAAEMAERVERMPATRHHDKKR